jgi:hypothetical protein
LNDSAAVDTTRAIAPGFHHDDEIEVIPRKRKLKAAKPLGSVKEMLISLIIFSLVRHRGIPGQDDLGVK